STLLEFLKILLLLFGVEFGQSENSATGQSCVSGEDQILAPGPQFSMIRSSATANFPSRRMVFSPTLNSLPSRLAAVVWSDFCSLWPEVRSVRAPCRFASRYCLPRR